MKTSILICLLVSLIPLFVFADKESTDADGDLLVLHRFVELLKADKRDMVAGLLRYPIRRAEPLKPIENEKEFLQHYDEFFDGKIIAMLDEGKRDSMTSWRGTMIADGSLYADGGKVYVINVSTPLMKKEVDSARSLAKSKTHESVRDYEGLSFVCKTKKNYVQVQELKNREIRYVSWKSEALSEKPDLILTKGETDWQGTARSVFYRFKNGDHLYELYKNGGACGADCNSYLRVYRGKEKVSELICQKT